MHKRFIEIIAVFLSLFLITLSAWAAEEDFVATTWRWQSTLSKDGTSLKPEAPENYTLIFDGDGTVNARADCNQMAGTFLRTGASLTIQLTHGTLAMCPPGSLDTEFKRQISEVRQVVFDGNSLRLNLAGDRATMIFAH
jgi:heat shock protein HslJ